MEVNSFLDNHTAKCRICFKNFTDDNKHVRISKIIEERFYELTQIALKPSKTKYSNFICELCSNDLEAFSIFKSDAILKQNTLYEFVDGVKERPKRARENISYEEFGGDFQEEIPIVKVELKEEAAPFEVIWEERGSGLDINELIERYDLKECTVMIEPMVKREIVEGKWIKPEIPDHFYDSASSDDLIDKAFKSLPPIPDDLKIISKSNHKVKRKKLFCKLCPKPRYFRKLEMLEVHLNDVHHKIETPCSFCGEMFTNKFKLQAHIERNHGGGPKAKEQCPECGKFVTCLNSHKTQVHGDYTRFTCDICGYGQYSKARLGKHMIRHMSKESKFEINGVTCHICGAKLGGGKTSLTHHMKNIHSKVEGKRYACHCGRSYAIEHSLKLHQRYKHQNGTKEFCCPICKRGFLTKQAMLDHKIVHFRKSKKEFPCDICGKLYGSPKLVESHKLFHGTPTIPCQYCGKMFHRKCLLMRHIKGQHEAEVGECKFCGKQLNVISMSKHVREFHSGLERKNCPVEGCGSMYLRKHHMKDHMERMHRWYVDSVTPKQLDDLLNKLQLPL